MAYPNDSILEKLHHGAADRVAYGQTGRAGSKVWAGTSERMRWRAYGRIVEQVNGAAQAQEREDTQ